MVAYSVWMVLLPLVALLGTIHVLPLQLALKHVQRARAAGAASVAAAIVLTNLLPQAEYQRVSVEAQRGRERAVYAHDVGRWGLRGGDAGVEARREAGVGVVEAEAHRAMEASEHFGKLVLRVA